MSESIAKKLDAMLADDRNFSTRAGLRFMAELVRDAFIFIENEKERQEASDDKQDGLEMRLKNVENALYGFLKKREAEQKEAESERTKWRWAIITPTIGMLLTELFRWWAGKP